MNIMLGNLSTTQIQERLGIALSKSEIYEMEQMRQHKAENIASGKWHCFDMPFTILCGSMETAIKVRDILAPYSDKMNGTIQISIYN